MYIITKDIFGTWKKGAIIDRQMVEDYFKVGWTIALLMLDKWKFAGYIKPYKANSRIKKK